MDATIRFTAGGTPIESAGPMDATVRFTAGGTPIEPVDPSMVIRLPCLMAPLMFNRFAPCVIAARTAGDCRRSPLTATLLRTRHTLFRSGPFANAWQSHQRINWWQCVAAANRHLRNGHRAPMVLKMSNHRFEIKAGVSRALAAALLLTVAALVAASPFFKSSSLRLSSIEAGDARLAPHGNGIREQQ